MLRVELQNIHKAYFPDRGDGAVDVLRGVDLRIDGGEYITVMGPSGSGKTTLLNILGCLDSPTAGRYFLDGQDVAKLTDGDLSRIRGSRMGFIFQSFHLIHQLSVLENIAVPLYYRGVSESAIRRIALRLAEQVGLADRLQHRPAELSGGQQQRVAIARALSNDPAMILADEPTGNLDSRTGGEILDLLATLNREGRTLVLVTHNQGVAAEAARRIELLDGRIESDRLKRDSAGSLS
jgi:putative ABC transport system ATP-binding protein